MGNRSGPQQDAALIRLALQTELFGRASATQTGKEALAALDRLMHEMDELREQVNSGRTHREALEGLPEGTLPRV